MDSRVQVGQTYLWTIVGDVKSCVLLLQCLSMVPLELAKRIQCSVTVPNVALPL